MGQTSFDYSSCELRTVPCPICGSNEFKLLASNDRYQMKIKTVGCPQCGLVMTNPRLDDDSLANFYRDHYRAFYQHIDKPSLEYVTRLKKDLRAIHTIDFLEGLIELEDGKTVLDIGCAEGTYLSELNSRFTNANLVGIEPNVRFAEFASEMVGCQIWPELDSLPEELLGKVDLLMMTHVLEHIPDLEVFLRRLQPLFSGAGKLYIDVPDIAYYKNIDDLHIAHLYHFSIGTLTAILQKSGYAVDTIEQHCPPNHPRSIRAVCGVSQLACSCGLEKQVFYWEKITRLNRLSQLQLLARHPRINPTLRVIKNVLSNKREI